MYDVGCKDQGGIESYTDPTRRFALWLTKGMSPSAHKRWLAGYLEKFIQQPGQVGLLVAHKELPEDTDVRRLWEEFEGKYRYGGGHAPVEFNFNNCGLDFHERDEGRRLMQEQGLTII